MFRLRMASMGVGALALVALAVPVFASAQTASIETRVLIPNGNTVCPPVFAQDVHPYVYDGDLDSFDVTLSDPAYVSVLGSVGDTPISLRYMTRRINADGSLRIHVDVESTRVGSSLPVSLTLLSAKAQSPVCISVLSFNVTGMGIVTITPTTPIPAPSAPHAPSKPAAPSTPEAPAGPSMTDDGTSTPAVAVWSLKDTLEKACEAAGPYQLWFILIALYMIGVGIVAFIEPPLARKGMWLPIALILIPLVLLVAFWYFAPACRVALWIPFVLIAAAALGLLSALREEPNVASILQLPPAKK